MSILKKLMPVKYIQIEKLVAVDYAFFNGRYIPTRFGKIQKYIPIKYKPVPVLYKP